MRDVAPGGGRDVLPGQLLECPAQDLLISQRREHVLTALLGDPLGGIGLGVHRIGADHYSVQVEGLEQFPERGDLIGLVCHTCPGKDSARGLVQGRQEMRCRILTCAGPAHGLAVHPNDCSSFDGAGTCTEPGPHMSVEVRGVPPYRRQAPTTSQHPRHGQGQHRIGRSWHTPRLSRRSVRFLRTWARGWSDKAVVVEDDMEA